MEVAGMVEVLDEGWAPVMRMEKEPGVNWRVGNGDTFFVRMANRFNQHPITATLGLLSTAFLFVLQLTPGPLEGRANELTWSPALPVRLFLVLGIRRRQLSIDIQYYDRRCFPISAKYALAPYACLSRETAQQACKQVSEGGAMAALVILFVSIPFEF